LHAPLPDLEQRARLAFGVPWAAKQAAAASGGSSGLRGGGPYSGAGGSAGRGERPFRFLSSFKWETRKGWDVLLDAFLSEFDGSDAVELYILTHAWEGEPGDARGFGARMAAWAQSRLPERVAAAASFGEGDSGGARRLSGMMGGGSAAEAEAAARQREAAEVAFRSMREWAAGRAAELRPQAAATQRRRLLSANSSSIAVQQQQHLQQQQQQQQPPRPPSPSPPPSPPPPPPSPPRFDTLAWPTVYVIDAHVVRLSGPIIIAASSIASKRSDFFAFQQQPPKHTPLPITNRSPTRTMGGSTRRSTLSCCPAAARAGAFFFEGPRLCLVPPVMLAPGSTAHRHTTTTNKQPKPNPGAART
jgi:hypothetical protein